MNGDDRSLSAIAAFLEGNVVVVARGLLGWHLLSEIDGERTAVVIDEVEAYGGEDDPASHSYRGRTPRNDSMFRGPGTLYVYQSYGVHWCANIVTGPVGEPGAVLLRGGVPGAGIEAMVRRRGRSDHLSDGPGKLCAALAITGAHDGSSVLGGPVQLVKRALPPGVRIESGPRVGITKAVDRPWRFVARSEGGSSLTAT